MLAILKGDTTMAEAARQHGLTVAEIERWQARVLVAAVIRDPAVLSVSRQIPPCDVGTSCGMGLRVRGSRESAPRDAFRAPS